MKLLNAIIILGLALIAIPAFLAGGWIVAAIFGILWFLLTRGSKEAWDWKKQRDSGATAAKYKRPQLLERDGDDGRRWER